MAITNENMCVSMFLMVIIYKPQPDTAKCVYPVGSRQIP